MFSRETTYQVTKILLLPFQNQVGLKIPQGDPTSELSSGTTIWLNPLGMGILTASEIPSLLQTGGCGAYKGVGAYTKYHGSMSMNGSNHEEQ